MAQVQLPTGEQKAQVQQQLQMAAQQAEMASQQTGQPVPPPEPPKEVVKLLKKPTQEEVAAFLRNDRARGFTIEIETDSTIQPDEDAEKQRRIEFGTAIGGIFQQAVPVVMQAPVIGPFVVEVMKFMAGGFRAGRPLEAAMDQLGEIVEGMAEKAAGPQEPPVDPVALAKIETDKRRVDLEEKRYEEVEKPTAAAELQIKTREADRADKVEQRNDDAHMTDKTLKARDADRNDRAQTHTERAHNDTRQDSKEARRADDDFRRDEKGVQRPDTDAQAFEKAMSEHKAGEEKAESAAREQARDAAIAEILAKIKAPRGGKLVKQNGKTVSIEIDGHSLPVSRDADGSISIG
jgi:hypothetical protein